MSRRRRPLRVFLITLAVTLAAGFSLVVYASATGKVSFALGAFYPRGNTVYSVSDTARPIRPAGDALAGAETELAERIAARLQKEKERVEEAATEERPPVTLVFAGDILFSEGYHIINSIRVNGGTMAGVMGESLLREMNEADYCIVNNEFPYTDEGAPLPGKTFTFHAKPESAKLLHEMGVDLVSLANNHAYDYGETGLVNSLKTLQNEGIPYVGAGMNLEEASRAYLIEDGGKKIAIIASTNVEHLANPDTKGATEASPGVFRSNNDALLIQRIREAKEAGAFVILFIHWGTENTTALHWLQKQQASELTQAGADLIVGAHSHCLQPLDYVNGVPILHSLGNFLFNSKTLDSCLLEVTIGTEGLERLRFIPCVQSGGKVRMSEGTEKARILQYMRDISPHVSIDEEGNVSPK